MGYKQSLFKARWHPTHLPYALLCIPSVLLHTLKVIAKNMERCFFWGPRVLVGLRDVLIDTVVPLSRVSLVAMQSSFVGTDRHFGLDGGEIYLFLIAFYLRGGRGRVVSG